MAEFLEQGQRRIDDTRTWAVGAADLLLDRLDDLVPVPWFLGDEVENDQAKVAMSEEAAKSGSAAAVMPSVTGLGVVVAVFPAGEAPVVVVMGVSMGHK
ncbi:MAG TPA: hypothetical protein VGI78_03185 [Acetobacteraceae bacterium]